MSGGALTAEQLIVALKNIGYDLTCGHCAGLFYTGAAVESHDVTCGTDVLRARDAALAAQKAAEARVAELERERDEARK